MKPTILVDPFPRTMELIFTKDKLKYLNQIINLLKEIIHQKKIFIIGIFLMLSLLLDNQHLNYLL